jgi:hypothetical protein
VAVAVYGQKIGEMGVTHCPSGYTTHTVSAHGPVEQVCCPDGLEPRPVGELGSERRTYGCFAPSGTPMPEWVQEAMKRTPPVAAAMLPSKPKLIAVAVVAGGALLGVSWAFYKAFRGRRSR